MNDTTVDGTDLLEQVRHAWADALDVDVDTVPLDTSFFDAGGNSLLLLLLWEQLNDMTARELRAADLFEHNTVLAQARLLSSDHEHQLSVLGARHRGRLLGRARRGPTTGTESLAP